VFGGLAFLIIDRPQGDTDDDDIAGQALAPPRPSAAG
jgi:hypothetical protein